MPTLLECPNCHAPLPPPAGGFSICQYCRYTTSVAAAGGAEAVVRAVPNAPPADQERTFEERRKTATDTFLRVISQNGTPEQAAWYAAHDYGAKDFDPRDVFAGSIALARDFDKKNRTKTASEAVTMVRLFEGYMRLVNEIRTSGKSEINLPFLTANEDGPVHLSGTYDATSIYELIKRFGPKQ